MNKYLISSFLYLIAIINPTAIMMKVTKRTLGKVPQKPLGRSYLNGGFCTVPTPMREIVKIGWIPLGIWIRKTNAKDNRRGFRIHMIYMQTLFNRDWRAYNIIW